MKIEFNKFLNESNKWDYELMDEIVDDVEELSSIIGKYDDEPIIQSIDSIINKLENLRNK